MCLKTKEINKKKRQGNSNSQLFSLWAENLIMLSIIIIKMF